MTNVTLNEAEYTGLNNYLGGRKIGSYEELLSKFLEIKEEGTEDRWYNETILIVSKDKFDGNLMKLYNFIKENSVVKTYAEVRGTLTIDGYVTKELDNEEDVTDIDWDSVNDEGDFEDISGIEFDTGSSDPDIETKLEMYTFRYYEDRMSTSEMKEVA